MKIVNFLFLIMLLFPVKVCANSTEDVLNDLSARLKSLETSMDNKDILDKYPIGSIYISKDKTNPGEIFGGTWVSYASGRTLIGMGNNGTQNYTTIEGQGGSETVTLSKNNIPSHLHTYTASGSVSSTFSGSSVSVSGSNHTHTITAHKTGDEAGGYGLEGGSDGFKNRVIVTSSSPLTTSSAGGHSHSVTPAGSVSSSFSSSSQTTSSSGSTSAFSKLNPYITVYIWKRTA